MNFIEWCNNNQGFLSFLLSTITLILSIIAIVVSIITMKNPYKKRIIVEASCMYDGSENKVYVWISNVGNKVISVKQIDIIYNNVHIGGTANIKTEKRILKSSEIKEYIVKAFIAKNNVEDFIENGKVIVTDTENQKFKSEKILPMI